jgi:hypothetical protein
VSKFSSQLFAQQKLYKLADKIKGLTQKLVLSKALCFERKSYLKNNLLSQSHLCPSVKSVAKKLCVLSSLCGGKCFLNFYMSFLFFIY